ncbi:hypothetical protein OAO62_01460 [Gammaproteobacteria bacterium]|nr:hypothetical protein [Gammaproteobacteria bacterium]
MKTFISIALLFFSSLFISEEIDWNTITVSELEELNLTDEQLGLMPLDAFVRLDGTYTMEVMTLMMNYALLKNHLFMIQEFPDNTLLDLLTSYRESKSMKESDQLTFRDFEVIAECASKLHEPRVTSIAETRINIEEIGAYATASLIIDDGNKEFFQLSDPASPISQTEIVCTSKDICAVFTADLILPSFGNNTSHRYLVTKTNFWDVETWATGEKITITTSDDCRNYSMTINQKSLEIIQVVTNNSVLEECSNGVPRLERPQISTSKDMKYQLDYWKARNEKVKNICNFGLYKE